MASWFTHNAVQLHADCGAVGPVIKLHRNTNSCMEKCNRVALSFGITSWKMFVMFVVCNVTLCSRSALFLFVHHTEEQEIKFRDSIQITISSRHPYFMNIFYERVMQQRFSSSSFLTTSKLYCHHHAHHLIDHITN